MASILIVEDDGTLRGMYQAAFEAAGYATAASATGAQALALLQQRHFDAIVLDLLMTGLTGMDVLRQHDFRRRNPDTQIIIVSNLDSENMRKKAGLFGARHYLVKAEYTPRQLVEAVTGWLGRPAADS